jgi:hypothetical protein
MTKKKTGSYDQPTEKKPEAKKPKAEKKANVKTKAEAEANAADKTATAPAPEALAAKPERTDNHNFDGVKESQTQEPIEFKLTDSDYSEKGRKISNLHSDLIRAKNDQDRSKKFHKAKVESIESEISVLAEVMKSGVETRLTECTKIMDYNSNRVEFVVSGEIMKERMMNDYEKQLDMLEINGINQARKAAAETAPAQIERPINDPPPADPEESNASTGGYDPDDLPEGEPIDDDPIEHEETDDIDVNDLG